MHAVSLARRTPWRADAVCPRPPPQHLLSLEQLAEKHGTRIDLSDPSKSLGLSPAQAELRLAAGGPNRLSPPRETPVIVHFLKKARALRRARGRGGLKASPRKPLSSGDGRARALLPRARRRSRAEGPRHRRVRAVPAQGRWSLGACGDRGLRAGRCGRQALTPAPPRRCRPPRRCASHGHSSRTRSTRC